MTLGLPINYYKSHSLRIGSATTLSMNGVNPETIQIVGRWESSQVMKRYIRTSC